MKRVCLLSENALSIQGVGRRQPAARILPQGHTAARIAQGHGAVGVVATVLEADIARVTGRRIVRVEIRQVHQAVEGAVGHIRQAKSRAAQQHPGSL